MGRINRFNHNKVGGLLLILIIGGSIIYGLIYGESFKKHRISTIGTVIKWKGGGASGQAGVIFIVYNYTVNKKVYQGTKSYAADIFSKDEWEKFFVGKQILVQYDSTNIFVVDALIMPGDYKSYNLKYPDSLRWVYNYISGGRGRFHSVR
jgi:hypothetical protein